MKAIFIIFASLGLLAFAATADATTIMFVTNNIILLMVIAILMISFVVVVVKALDMRQHNITVIDNRSWSTDNSTHNATSKSYFDYRDAGRLEDSTSFLSTLRD